MPVKQVGSSLFELDQDDKNGQNGVSLLYLPLLPPMPKVGFLKVLWNYKNTPNEIRGAKALQSGFFPRNPVLSFFFKEVHSQSLTGSVFTHLKL